MLITVTDGDIRDGVASSCSQCPVALAIARACGLEDVTVWGYVIEFYSERCRLFHTATPEVSRTFIHRFDRGASVKAFSFELPLTAGQIAAIAAAKEVS